MSRDQIMKALKEILASKDIIQKVRDLNFNKEVQVKYETNTNKHIILRNRYFGRSDRDREEKRIDEIEKSRREKENELKKLFATDNQLIDLLLELHEIIRDMKIMLKKNEIKTQ